MNCFLLISGNKTISTIGDIPQKHCDKFRNSYNNVTKLISLHSLFSYVQIAWEELQNLREEFANYNNGDIPLSEKNLVLAEKACRDFLFHYMTYCDMLDAFVKTSFGRGSKMAVSVEDKLKKMKRIPEVSLIHSFRNCVTHKACLLSFVRNKQGAVEFLADAAALQKQYKQWETRDLRLMKSYGNLFDVVVPFEKAYNELFNFHCLLSVKYINDNKLGNDIHFLLSFKQGLQCYISKEGDEIFFGDAHDENGNSVTREDFEHGKGTGFVVEWIKWETLGELVQFLVADS